MSIHRSVLVDLKREWSFRSPQIVSSSHLSEALAAAAGFRTHAALKQSPQVWLDLDQRLFRERLQSLGYFVSKPDAWPQLSNLSYHRLSEKSLDRAQIRSLCAFIKMRTGLLMIAGPRDIFYSLARDLSCVSAFFNEPVRCLDMGLQDSDRTTEMSTQNFHQQALIACMRSDPDVIVSVDPALVKKVVQSGSQLWLGVPSLIPEAFEDIREVGPGLSMEYKSDGQWEIRNHMHFLRC